MKQVPEHGSCFICGSEDDPYTPFGGFSPASPLRCAPGTRPPKWGKRLAQKRLPGQAHGSPSTAVLGAAVFEIPFP